MRNGIITGVPSIKARSIPIVTIEVLKMKQIDFNSMPSEVTVLEFLMRSYEMQYIFTT